MRNRLAIIAILFAVFVPWFVQATDVNDSMSYNKATTFKERVVMKEITAPSGNPAANYGWLYVKDSGGASRLYFESDDGTVTDLIAAAGGGVTLDGAYDYGGAGVGNSITVDQGAFTLTGGHATNDMALINKTTGSGDALQITNAGTGKDVNGTGGTWYVTKAGAAVFVSATIPTLAVTDLTATNIAATNIASANIAGAVTLDDGSGASPSLIFKDGSDETATFSKADAGVLSLTTEANDGLKILTGNLWVGNGTPGTVAMNGEDAYVEGDLEVDGAVQLDGALTVAGATTMSGAVTIDNAAVTLRANEAITFTHATNGAADDLTIALTGATDSSIILSSTGTGEDAIALQSSAGGVDVDAAAGKDVNIAGGQVALVSKDNAASAISLTANIGATETIVVTNTQGTSESAITLVATAGGVNVDAAAAKDLDLAGGQVKLVSKDDAAGAISLTANVGTSETITVTNTQGTAAGAIALIATAGGVDIDAAAAKDVDISGGQVLISSKDNAASAIALTANVGTSETIVITNTQGTGAGAITNTATAGGITNTVASGKAITQNGTVNHKVGSDIASPAGGELTLGDGQYFLITGTNNITSIAAASTTAGRLLFLRFDNILTFTDGNNLKLAGNLVTSADDTITLISDGTNWYELARSVN